MLNSTHYVPRPGLQRPTQLPPPADQAAPAPKRNRTSPFRAHRLPSGWIGWVGWFAIWLLWSSLASAQTLDFVKRAGGSGTDQGLSTATDADGNIYVTGSFSGTADFSGTTLVSAGGTDLFVAKYTAAGELQWVQRGGSTWDDSGNGIAVSNGGVYVTGSFQGTANFNTPSDPTSNTLVSFSGPDIFVAKYTTTGQLQWLQGAGGSDIDEGNGISVGSTGVYVTGYFNTSATFDSSPGGTLTSAGNNDVFLAKYTEAEMFQWVRRGGGYSSDSGTGVSVANGGVYVTGYITATADFNTPSNPASNTLTSAGNNDVFLMKYDESGTLQWLRRGGGTGADLGYAIAASSGGVYVTGLFNSTANFNTPSNQASNTLTSAGAGDMFLVKYDESGTLQWLRRGGRYGGGSRLWGVGSEWRGVRNGVL